MKISSRKALITGASSGFGRELAKSLVADGADVWLVARREERLEALAAELGSRARYTAVDLADVNQIKDFVDNHQELSEIDILINNAGLALGTGAFEKAPLEDFDQMLDVNVRALIHLTRRLLPKILDRGALIDIVNTGSVAGRWVYPGGSVYCASKFAVRALSEGLRLDLLGKNVRVTNIEPGMADTEFSFVRMRDQEAADAVYDGMTPLSGKDVADCITWVLQRPAHVNIQEMVIFPTDQAGVGHVHRNK